MLKNYVRVILVLCFSLILTNCQKEDNEINEIEKQDQFTIKRVTLKDLEKDSYLNHSIKNLSKRFDVNIKNEDLENRLNGEDEIESNDGSFIIRTDEILKLTSNTSETYAFRIKTPTDSTSLFENFVIDKVTDTSYSFYIYRYKNNDVENSNHKYRLSRIPVDKDEIDNSILAHTNGKIYYDEEEACFYDILIGQNGETVFFLLWCYNGDSGGGGGGGGNDGGNGNPSDGGSPNDGDGGGGSTGSGTSNPDDPFDPTDPNNHGGGGGTIIPVIEPEEDPLPEFEDDDNCDRINEQLENTNYQTAVATLQSNTGLKNETGFSEDINNNFTEAEQGVDGNSLDIPLTTTLQGFIHVHTDDYLVDQDGDGIMDHITRVKKMFSPGDILSFFELLNNASMNNIPLKNVYYSMISTSGNYTIRINEDHSNIGNNYDIYQLNITRWV